MEKFAEVVKAKSGSKIKVNLFPGGVLGGDAPTVSALQGSWAWPILNSAFAT